VGRTRPVGALAGRSRIARAFVARAVLLVHFVLVAAPRGAASFARAEEPFRAAAPGHAWSFPRDHWNHPDYRTEWWYFTGRLTSVDEPVRELGYQLTFFRVGLAPEPPALDSAWTTANMVMVHAAVTDLTGGTHHFSEVLWREMPRFGAFTTFPERPLAWARAPAGSEGRWLLDLVGDVFELRVHDEARGLAYHLTARPERPIVLQGPGGFSRKSERDGFGSLYYSATRLATEGTVTLGGRSWKVRGRSWMDREFGSSQLAAAQVGWDWFALQLNDGRDLMLYRLRRADGSIDFGTGTLVAADGGVRWLSAAEASIHPLATWRSAATGVSYPKRWRVEVPSAGLTLDVEAALEDQENRSSLVEGLFYWEGAVRIQDASGAAAGRGYVELTGYGEKSRPPI
jgi:predicted secreted hydrolase